LDYLIPVGKLHQTILSFDQSILDGHYMSHNRFTKELTTEFPLEFMYNEKDKIYFKHHFKTKDIPPPFRVDAETLYYPTYASSSTLLPNLLLYYAILYTLSMLSRYDTEWWNELTILKQSFDYPLIQQFLHHAPDLIMQEIAKYLYRLFEKYRKQEGESFKFVLFLIHLHHYPLRLKRLLQCRHRLVNLLLERYLLKLVHLYPLVYLLHFPR